MRQVDKAIISAPFGMLILYANSRELTGIEVRPAEEDRIPPATALLKEACRQLAAYFADSRFPFSLPRLEQGSAYQRRVWGALYEIPPGSVCSYGQLASELNSGPRAVAQACRANAFPLIVPCHRVIARNGLGGYCGVQVGPLLDIKRWLLRHEGYPLA